MRHSTPVTWIDLTSHLRQRALKALDNRPKVRKGTLEREGETSEPMTSLRQMPPLFKACRNVDRPNVASPGHPRGQYRQCDQCERPLFGKRRRDKRTYHCTKCNLYLHHQCVCRQHLMDCQLWRPVVLAKDEDEPPAAKRRKPDENCVICFEQGDETQWIETECCHQSAHVSCLRRYYDLPEICSTLIERETIFDELGIPSCFVCRGDPDNIVPLDRKTLNAILPKVDGERIELRRVMRDICKDTIDRLVRDWQGDLFQLKNMSFLVWRQSGLVGLGERFVVQEDLKTKEESAQTAINLLWRDIDQWDRKDQLRNIYRIKIRLTAIQWCRRAKVPADPDARPFALEYETVPLQARQFEVWMFDFDNVIRDRSPRMICWSNEPLALPLDDD